MKESERCHHPECIYRNHSDPSQTGRCNYLTMTGHSRTAHMPPHLRDPCYCTDYVPSGMPVPEKRADWKTEATRLYLAGATDREIAESLGLKYGTVQAWRYNQLKRPANPDVRGSGVKFDWERARELYRRGMSDIQIANELGCSIQSVRRWRTKQELLPNAGKKGGKKT